MRSKGLIIAATAGLLAVLQPISAYAEAPWLPQVLSDLHLPRLSWGMRMERVARALPQAVRTEHPCEPREKVRCLDLELSDWRYGDLPGELSLESRLGTLMTITFRGVVKTRAEEEAIVHRLHEVYGMPETRGSSDGPFVRFVRGMTPETFCDYTADEKSDGIHIELEFMDRRHVVVVEEEFLSPSDYEAALRRQERKEARKHRRSKPQ